METTRTVTVLPQAAGIFTPDCPTDRPDVVIGGAPIRAYSGYIRPDRDKAALEKGRQLAEDIRRNRIADFEKDEEYCRRHPGEHVDRMVHVSTFAVIGGIIYMTYYANTGTDAEDPSMQEARFAFCPQDDPGDRTVITLQKVGDLLDGRRIDRVYDTILLRRDDEVLYLMWTASADGLYYRFYRTYTIASGTLSAIRPNRFRVGDTVNDFSTSGIVSALAANGIPRKAMFSDIGIMQKLTARVENGETWYYTGAYSGYFNCIIKSRDFVTWEYVAAPDFVNLSLWENAVYVLEDKCWYFVRQEECMQGFLTCYDLVTGRWTAPCLVRDAQSRSDFVFRNGRLYLIHAPINREGFGILRVDRDDPARSVPIAVADLKESLFYPFTDFVSGRAWMSYTVGRRHIRLSWFDPDTYLV